jgi:hypothetical protein
MRARGLVSAAASSLASAAASSPLTTSLKYAARNTIDASFARFALDSSSLHSQSL